MARSRMAAPLAACRRRVRSPAGAVQQHDCPTVQRLRRPRAPERRPFRHAESRAPHNDPLQSRRASRPEVRRDGCATTSGTERWRPVASRAPRFRVRCPSGRARHRRCPLTVARARQHFDKSCCRRTPRRRDRVKNSVRGNRMVSRHGSAGVVLPDRWRRRGESASSC